MNYIKEKTGKIKYENKRLKLGNDQKIYQVKGERNLHVVKAQLFTGKQ